MRISVNEELKDDEEYLAAVDYLEARLCEDYILINLDLEDAIFFGRRALSSLKQANPERDAGGNFNFSDQVGREFEADWIAAVVKYYRCFRDGVRTVLPETILTLPGAKEAHDYFLDLRHRHIVHAVNGFEQAKVFVVLPPKGTENASVKDVGGFCMRRTIESPENLETFLSLAALAKTEADILFASAQKSVFERAKKDSLENLYAFPYASLTVTGGVDGAKSKRPGRPRSWNQS